MVIWDAGGRFPPGGNAGRNDRRTCPSSDRAANILPVIPVCVLVGLVDPFTEPLYRLLVAEPQRAGRVLDNKAERRAARELIAAYHQQQLRALLERIRDGFTKLDAGEIDEFTLDELIHRYKRAAADLWSFCGSTGGQWLQAASTLTYLREQGEEPDWWARSAPRRGAPS